MPSRKRMASNEARPSSGVRFDTSTYDADVTGNYLVSFTNGQLNSDDGIGFSVFQEKQGSGSFRKKHIVAESENMTYIGHNTGAFAESKDYKTVVGIFDRKSNVTKLYSAESYLLKPVLGGNANPDEDIVEEETRRERIDALTSAFGASKKRKTMEARHQNAIMGDTLLTAIQDVASTETNLDTPEPEVKNSMADIIPPHDLDADTPAAAYPLNGIISDDVMAALKGQNEHLGTEKIPVKSQYIKKMLDHLPHSEQLREPRKAILQYMTYLMHLYKLQYKELRRIKDPIPSDVPFPVKRCLENQFIVKVNRSITIPIRKKDALLAYILILALHLEDFKMALSTLCIDLGLTMQKMTTHLRVLGCTISTDKNKDGQVAELKIPLKLGEAPVKRTRRR